MMHAGPSHPQPSRNPRPGRVLFALLVMLAAVMPHLTLLAAPGLATPRPASSGMSHHAPAAPAPCHDSGTDRAVPPKAPACCVAACTLLPAPVEIALPARLIVWEPWREAERLPGPGLAPEPAKPPPRTEQLRA